MQRCRCRRALLLPLLIAGFNCTAFGAGVVKDGLPGSAGADCTGANCNGDAGGNGEAVSAALPTVDDNNSLFVKSGIGGKGGNGQGSGSGGKGGNGGNSLGVLSAQIDVNGTYLTQDLNIIGGDGGAGGSSGKDGTPGAGGKGGTSDAEMGLSDSGNCEERIAIFLMVALGETRAELALAAKTEAMPAMASSS